MEISVKIDAPELAQAIQALADSINSSNIAGIPDTITSETAGTKVTHTPESVKVEAEEIEIEPTPEPVEEPKEEKPKQPEISLDVVTTKVREFIQKGGRNDLKAFLDERGAGKVTDLDPEHYPALLELTK